MRAPTTTKTTTNGVTCPGCGCARSEVYYVKRRPGKTIRARTCSACKRRFRTAEVNIGGTVGRRSLPAEQPGDNLPRDPANGPFR